MKRIVTIITSVMLCVTMLILVPAQIAARAAENTKKTYVSEVKIGMGETSEEASKELLAEGYTILKDDKGDYADLNKGAGTKNALKAGPNQKIVYFGYKTTENASEAITDLAVMNMYGDYTFIDYQLIMQAQAETQIKPFINRFLATLTEYRDNLKKPKNSINYIRADYYRSMLNKLTDDDTGGKPLGDLLLNKTKYEMGDDAYNQLSAEEKKNHCDIVTLLMQGNGQAVQLLETTLAKAADSADNTWLDRFLKTSLNDLTEEVKKENPNLTPTDINAELDKRYNDDAKKILDKWGTFNEVLLNYDNAVSNAEEVLQDEKKDQKEIAVSDNPTAEETKEALDQKFEAQSTMLKGGLAAEDIVVHEYLGSVEFEDASLLDFFEKDSSEFNDEDTIRELYPIVEALSGGQIAGLDFLSIKDMILMAITDENGYKAVKIDNVPAASIFQGTNREIYDVGGFAVTKGTTAEAFDLDLLATMMVLGALENVLTIGAIVTGTAAYCSAIELERFKSSQVFTRLHELEGAISNAQSRAQSVRILSRSESFNLIDDSIISEKDSLIIEDNAAEASLRNYKNSPEYQQAARQLASKSRISDLLMGGLSVIGAIMEGITLYTTITELIAEYKVTFAPVPKYMMHEVEIEIINEKGEKESMGKMPVMYKTVPCNRPKGDNDFAKNNYKILKNCNDLNGDVGKQWLSLYSIKNAYGKPILADSLKMQSGDTLPDGYSTGIHRFGQVPAFNLTSKYYCYNDPNKGTYVYYKHDTTPVQNVADAVGKSAVAGSVFSGSMIALGAVIGLVVGCGAAAIIMLVTGKKKKSTSPKA